MISRILAQLVGTEGKDGDVTEDTDNCSNLLEFDDGEWVIINIHARHQWSIKETKASRLRSREAHLVQPPILKALSNENQSLGSSDTNILENLLIEHPSMSVYQMRPDQGDLGSDQETDDVARPVPVRRHVSWRLAAWGSPLPCSTILLSVQRARVYNEHRKLTRGALNRQNLARTRYSPSERRYGYFKQPAQRLYNY